METEMNNNSDGYFLDLLSIAIELTDSIDPGLL